MVFVGQVVRRGRKQGGQGEIERLEGAGEGQAAEAGQSGGGGGGAGGGGGGGGGVSLTG